MSLLDWHQHRWLDTFQEPTYKLVAEPEGALPDAEQTEPLPMTYIQHQICHCGSVREVQMPSGIVRT